MDNKSGKVYFGISTRSDGSEKIYVGQTRRSVFKRTGEHIKEIKKGNSKTYVGRGINFKLIGSIYSTNRYKAEKTIKKMSPSSKRRLARHGAKKYKSSKSGQNNIWH